MGNKGDAIGRFELALSYLNGEDKSMVNALKWLAKAFEVVEGNGTMDALRTRFSETKGQHGEFDCEFEKCIKSYEYMKDADLLRESDKAKAFEAYKKAAEIGNAEAQNWVGKYYLYGWGDCEKDHDKAMEWFRKSAEQMFASGVYNVGLCYDEGYGVQKDEREAMKWYTKAAQQGLPLGQFELGQHYRKGRGVEKDPEEAVRWYEKAAEQGQEDAMGLLGDCYYHGWGVEEDNDEAVKWYRRASEHNNRGAMYMLGNCYEKGHGVNKDWNLARKWYKEAADKGHEKAKEALESLESRSKSSRW